MGAALTSVAGLLERVASQRSEGADRRYLLAGGVLLTGCVIALSVPSAARPSTWHTVNLAAARQQAVRHVPLITVHARIRVFSNPIAPRNSLLAAREVTFSPKVINVGTVRIIVTNSDTEPHLFEINGVLSKKLLEGGRGVMIVKFKKPGLYPVSVTTDTPSAFSGQLRVVA